MKLTAQFLVDNVGILNSGKLLADNLSGITGKASGIPGTLFNRISNGKLIDMFYRDFTPGETKAIGLSPTGKVRTEKTTVEFGKEGERKGVKVKGNTAELLRRIKLNERGM